MKFEVKRWHPYVRIGRLCVEIETNPRVWHWVSFSRRTVVPWWLRLGIVHVWWADLP